MPEILASLRQLALSEGAVLFGVAELSQVVTSDFMLDAEIIHALPRAISIAARVSTTVLSTITDHPNLLYFHHYRQLNTMLDRVTLKLAQILEAAGYRALTIAASQIVDWQNQRAHLSHKRIAVAAGLGWIGRNNLLVTVDRGSQVRLATVLTDAPLAISMPETESCGECRACIAVCPAQAIKETAQDFDHLACFAQLKEFQRKGYVGQYVCGICVRACRAKTMSGSKIRRSSFVARGITEP
jgi:epoxyqueuosine reductase QueG